MKKFIIERDLPGAGKLNKDELKEITKVSCTTVEGLGKPYHWLETFVTENKMFCIHIAENADVIKEHSAKAGFPVKSIREVNGIIGPAL